MAPAEVSATVNPLRRGDDKRLPRIAGPCSMVMFGVTGDLARKKLLPAIYDLASRGLLPAGFSLVGYGRRDWSDAEFAEFVREAVREHARTAFRDEVWASLEQGFRFVSGAFDDDEGFEELSRTVAELDVTRGTGGNHAFYLSIPPSWFGPVCEQLERVGLSTPREDTWRRVIIEKPFGHDLSSAEELNGIVESVFPPDAVFRIDHYLGKETVQNLLALRFSNTMFEPIWTANYVDHVQITMSEDIGIGGRAGYYDDVGAARDVIQNHLLQLLALTAMEEPSGFTADAIRSEKEKVLARVELPDDLSSATARGQYTAGWQGGEKVIGYLDEDGVPKTSQTETYAALKLEVNTRRWAGVPFYLRTGKRLGKRVTEIAVVFSKVAHLAPDGSGAKNGPGPTELGHNAIVVRVQPDEGMTVRFGSKIPGSQMDIRDVSMDFGYGQSFTEDSPEAYERLILDVLLGDPPLFPRHEEVEQSWRILDPVIKHWERDSSRPCEYEAGTWGPRTADELLARDGREWRLP